MFKNNIRKIIILFIAIIFTVLTFIFLSRTEKIPEGIIILSGRIEGREVNVSPKIQGRIIKLYKEDGDKVRSGELLCQIFSDQLEARYKNAKETARSALHALSVTEANLRKALASYEKAKKDFERYSSLVEKEVVTKNEFELVKMQYELAKAELDASQKSISQAEAHYKATLARLNEAEADLKEAKIYSPTDGVIISRTVEQGEIVNPGSVIYVIVDLNRLYAKVYIPEYRIGEIKLGDPARVYVDSYPDKYFNGKITKVYDQAEFTPKNVETKEERIKLVFGVEVSVENPEGLLKPGMPVDVVIKYKENAQWIKPK